jgi:hypothetical protein
MWVHLTYLSGVTDSLFAGPFSCENRNGCAYLVVDLSRNLHTRNKQENSYGDALELANSKHSTLKAIEIDSSLVERFAKFIKQIEVAGWRLEITIEDKVFTYLLEKSTRRNGTTLLDLSEEKA